MASIRGPREGGLFGTIPGRVKNIIFITSINTLAVGYFTIVLTAYLPQIGVGSEVVGLVVGAEGIALIVAGIPLGLLSDRRGRKWILILSACAFAPVLFIVAFTRSTDFLILAGTIGGIAEGGFLSTFNAIIADLTPPKSRDKTFSLSFVASTVSLGIGSSIPFAFPYLEGVLSTASVEIHRDALILMGFVAMSSPICLWAVLRSYDEGSRIGSNFSSKGGLKDLLKFSGTNSIIGLGAGFIIPLIATWFYLKFGVGDTYTGPLLALSNITIGLAAAFSPLMSRKFGIVRAIAINQGLSTVFMASLAFVGDPIVAATL